MPEALMVANTPRPASANSSCGSNDGLDEVAVTSVRNRGPHARYSRSLPMPDDAVRDDLAELLRRRALTEDAGRPDAVGRRHAAGGRTARENIADLIDDGSF